MQQREMHHIEIISADNIRQAVAIRAECYGQDYRGVLPQEKLEAYDFEDDLKEISFWLFQKTEDFRLGYLYYINQEPVGMAIGSLAEREGYLHAVELNYLFVLPEARQKGVGRQLIMAVAAKYREHGIEGLLLYNWRDLASNQFYRKLSPDLLATEIQTPGGKSLETDIFYWPINRLLAQGKINKVVWFSGTGGVRHVAELLSSQLLSRGRVPLSMSMPDCLAGHFNSNMDCSQLSGDYLFVLYPVHAFDAPEIVYKWLESLPKGQGEKTVVLSVSGGGEVWPNTSCRRKVIQQLSKKDYQVVYERMLVMPPNMLIEAGPDLVSHIVRALPEKISDLLNDLEADVVRRDRIKLSSAWMGFISKLERQEARRGSDHFRVNDNCDGCGLCAEFCPVQNMEPRLGEKPIFGDECLLCLKCYYGCPQRAIEAPKLERWLFKSYQIEALKRLGETLPLLSAREASKGLAWIGVRRYLTRPKY